MLMLGFLTVLLVACTGGWPLGKADELPWTDTPPPPPPDSSRFSEGDPDKRPVIHKFFVTPIAERNGWLIVPIESWQLTAWVDNAEKVAFYRYSLDQNEEFNPDMNGKVENGVPQGTTEGGHVIWTATRRWLADPIIGVYAVAENKYGRAVSEILFVAIDPYEEKRQRSLHGDN